MYALNTGPERIFYFYFLQKLEDILCNCQPDEFLFLAGEFSCIENNQLDRNHLEPHLCT